MTVIGSQRNLFVVFSIIRKDGEDDYDAIACRLGQNVNNILKLWINTILTFFCARDPSDMYCIYCTGMLVTLYVYTFLCNLVLNYL